MTDGIDEQALVGPAGHDGGPTEAPGDRRLPGGERKPRFLFRRPVTLLTVGDENRPHPALEELELSGWKGFVSRRPCSGSTLEPEAYGGPGEGGQPGGERQRGMTAGKHPNTFRTPPALLATVPRSRRDSGNLHPRSLKYTTAETLRRGSFGRCPGPVSSI